jgi:hypothetical protein
VVFTGTCETSLSGQFISEGEVVEETKAVSGIVALEKLYFEDNISESFVTVIEFCKLSKIIFEDECGVEVFQLNPGPEMGVD